MLTAGAWTPVPVDEDPLLRMPGSQPGSAALEGSGRCLNCHANYDPVAEPGHNWKGSMMAQAARDPIWYACVAVAAQDSIWAVGNPNAADLCIRCHSPSAWLGGRSDPTNMSLLTGDDFDGVSCDACHTMWDPFFETTWSGTREGNDWTGYWDEATLLSQDAADLTYAADVDAAKAVQLFSGAPFFVNNEPVYFGYTENASGQYFVSSDGAKRASFADHGARHQVHYSRYHKSKYMCATCHDVSNPVLANLGLSGLPDLSGGTDQISEQYAAHRYFHVERTFSEFMLSAYGQPGGAETNAEFRLQGAPDITHASKCQDCHMRDVTGYGCNKNGVPLRPTESLEHPNSGMPLHDMTGGNVWISYILATLQTGTEIHDPVNASLLGQGPEVLTLDLSGGESPLTNSAALLAGHERARQQLRLAATLLDVQYDPVTGTLALKVQNNTGHKLISGFPEGRRMFLNIRAYDTDNTLIREVNPYDTDVGTLKGVSPLTSLLEHEIHRDDLVYEVHPSSSLTGEDETFHFVLADGRHKDNRIPPKGFRSDLAAERLSLPVDHGSSAPAMYSESEYAGGFDAVTAQLPTGASRVEIALYYQGTSREYIEFLRNEINGTSTTLPGPGNSGLLSAYVIQSDPFFEHLRAWGDTIWNLWHHNHGLDGSGAEVPGIVPFAMTEATWTAAGAPPLSPDSLTAEAASTDSISLSWSAGSGNEITYHVEHATDPTGTWSEIGTTASGTTTFLHTGLATASLHSYRVSASNDNGRSEPGDVVTTRSRTLLRQWCSDHGLPADGTGEGAPGADPDLDGLANIFEFACVTNPTDPADRHEPQMQTVELDGASHPTLSFRCRNGGTLSQNTYQADGIIYTVEISATMEENDWTADATSIFWNAPAGDNGDGSRNITVRTVQPVSTGGPAFLHLKLEEAPLP